MWPDPTDVESRLDPRLSNTLFHVPTEELARVLGCLHATLRPGGVLFCSSPHGPDVESVSGSRYAAYHSLEKWRGM